MVTMMVKIKNVRAQSSFRAWHTYSCKHTDTGLEFNNRAFKEGFTYPLITYGFFIVYNKLGRPGSELEVLQTGLYITILKENS